MKSINLEGFFEEGQSLVKKKKARTLNRYFSSYETYKIPEGILSRFLKQSSNPKDLEGFSYHIFTDKAMGNSKVFSNNLRYYDAPYSFVLMKGESTLENSIDNLTNWYDKTKQTMKKAIKFYKKSVRDSVKLFLKKNAPIASISFSLLDSSTIIVGQIQGVQGEQESLQSLKWERMLLTLTCNWAKQNGFEKIHVTPAEKNRYSAINQGTRGKMLYDVTAKRCGFKKDDTGYFSKNL